MARMTQGEAPKAMLYIFWQWLIYPPSSNFGSSSFLFDFNFSASNMGVISHNLFVTNHCLTCPPSSGSIADLPCKFLYTAFVCVTMRVLCVGSSLYRLELVL